MLSRVVKGRGLVNNFGYFTYLKERYRKEKVFHILDKIDNQQIDETKQLEFQKTLILIRNDIDGDRVGIQAIKLYLSYLCIQEKQLIRSKEIQSDDLIFYKSISDKCANVDLIKQATIMSKIFYYLNGGDFKLLSLQLECDLLLRKAVCFDSTDKFEQVCLQERLKEVLDRLVKYTIKHYSNSDYQLIQTLLKQYSYHMIKSQQYMKQRSYQESLDELVIAQTQLNDLWQKLNDQDGFRVHYQRLIIKKLLITGQAKYLLKQDDGFQIIVDALNTYVDEIGMDEEYYQKFTEIAKFLRNFDMKACLQLLERIKEHDLNLQRLELEQIKIITMFKLDQLKISDVDQMIDQYEKLEIENDDVNCDYYIFFYNMKKLLGDFESAHKYLELILKNLLLQSHIEQSKLIINITQAISYQQLIQSPNAHYIYEISMQILEASCFRLKDNFHQLSFEDQVRTINTEKTIIIIQSDIDKLSILKNQKDASYQNTFNRLQYLDDQFQANQQFRLHILEILKDLGIEEKEVYEKIDHLRQTILDTEILE